MDRRTSVKQINQNVQIMCVTFLFQEINSKYMNTSVTLMFHFFTKNSKYISNFNHATFLKNLITTYLNKNVKKYIPCFIKYDPM